MYYYKELKKKEGVVMKPILEALYDGRIFPVEMISPVDPEYRQLDQKIFGLRAMWQKKLTGDDYKELENLLDLCQELSAMEVAASFNYGFRLGAMLQMEILSGREDLVRADD
jgi:hypothetical protein